MAYNGSGVFARIYNFVTDRTNGIKIRADRMDAELDGIASGLSNAICKDGQTTITNDIPFSNRKITGLGDATNATHALNRQSGDARYLQRPSTLTAETNIADDDIIGFYDQSATADRGITYANFKTDLVTEGQAAGTSFFPTGTRLPFQQTTPPTGWTKESGAAYNNAALRFTTGSVGTGGTDDFTTTFASRTFAGTVGNTTLTESQIPSHTHVLANTVNDGLVNPDLAAGEYLSRRNDDSGSNEYTLNGNATVPSVGQVAFTGGGGSHTHSLTMNAASFAVKYADCSIGVKA